MEPTDEMVQAGVARLLSSWHDGPEGIFPLIVRDLWRAMAQLAPDSENGRQPNPKVDQRPL